MPGVDITVQVTTDHLVQLVDDTLVVMDEQSGEEITIHGKDAIQRTAAAVTYLAGQVGAMQSYGEAQQ